MKNGVDYLNAKPCWSSACAKVDSSWAGVRRRCYENTREDCRLLFLAGVSVGFQSVCRRETLSLYSLRGGFEEVPRKLGWKVGADGLWSWLKRV